MQLTRLAFVATLNLLCACTRGPDHEVLTSAHLDSVVSEGMRLVEHNCADCMFRSADSLVLGLTLIDSALNHGFRDTIRAYQALARGYSIMAYVYANDRSEEQMVWTGKLRRTLKVLVEAQPDSADAWFEYAAYLEPGEEARDALRKATMLDPNHLPATYALGAGFIRRGEADSGFHYLARAWELANEQRSYRYLDLVEMVLKQNGYPSLADSLRARRQGG